MDAARQVLRFSIPGAVLLLNGMICFMIYRRVQGVGFEVTSALLRANVEPLVGVLATIPVGFVVYQAYYFNYGPKVAIWPFTWPTDLVRTDRACQVLGRLPAATVDQLAYAFDLPLDLTPAYRRVPNPGSWHCHPLEKTMHWLHCLRIRSDWDEVQGGGSVAYGVRWHNNWDVLRGMVEIAASLPGADHVKQEYTTLSDLFHALGAARTAVTLSWLAAVVLAMTHIGRILANPLESVIGLLLITGLSTMLWVIFHYARRRTWKSAASSIRLALRWLLHRNPEAFEIGVIASAGAARP
ncbi:MAG: hypothetical protein ACJ76D_04660 [Solirubrobacterales bacterium]